MSFANFDEVKEVCRRMEKYKLSDLEIDARKIDARRLSEYLYAQSKKKRDDLN
ncbi:hypothetical protein [Bacillus taeanensis]|uniref:hypothetical protein n=1 Tax=Bacillus taeanensis TaxID=273032 RepID=UPI0015F0D274|nr:hypothetical protein [Bacillus taeanensis]